MGVFHRYAIQPDRTWLLEPESCLENQLQVWSGYIAAKAIGQGDGNFRIRGFYIEFENVALPGDPVSAPVSFSVNDGIEYYQNLTGDRDYLRVPLAGVPTIQVPAGMESIFAEPGQGNRILLFAETAGSVGVNGLPFSDAVNSKIYGLAIIAAPDWNDPSQDLVFARGYYQESQQKLKSAGTQIGVSWQHTFSLS